jgi:hypothetical protein
VEYMVCSSPERELRPSPDTHPCPDITTCEYRTVIDRLLMSYVEPSFETVWSARCGPSRKEAAGVHPITCRSVQCTYVLLYLATP